MRVLSWHRKQLEQKIKTQNLVTEITLHGYTSNSIEFLQKATVYVHSALYEPFGLVLIEAMASSVPVVALNGKGNSDIIEDGKNGFLIENQDPNVFAEKIIELQQSEKLYKKIQAYAKAYATRFDIKDYVSSLLALYKGQ